MSDGWTREYVVEVKHAELIAGSPFSHPFREEIVRCRDCKYADETESGLLLCNGYLVESWDWYNDMPNDGMEVKPDGFCAWAERRDA